MQHAYNYIQSYEQGLSIQVTILVQHTDFMVQLEDNTLQLYAVLITCNTYMYAKFHGRA